MTQRTQRADLTQLAFSEAGRIAQKDALLRRQLDGTAGHASGALSHPQAAAAARPNAKAARSQRERGLQLLRAGRIGDAVGVLRAALLTDAEDPDTHFALGAALLQAGEFAAAASSLTQAIARRPDFALAHRDLGTALDRQGLDGEAAAAYQRALALSPRLAGVHRRLAEIYEGRGGFLEAIACYEQAAAAARNTTEGRLCQVSALILKRDFAAAEALARKAIALDPKSGDAHAALAGLLVTAGQTAEGSDHYARSLDLNPHLFGSWSGLVRARKFTSADQPPIDRMKAALATGKGGDPERMTLHFALGKLCDDAHDYAEAMRHFDAANAIRGRSTKMDRAGLAAWVDRIVQRFTPDLFEELGEFGTDDELPLLIVGMPRSGTTLVEQIVSSHPNIAAGDEIPFWTRYGLSWEGANGENFTPKAVREKVAQYLAILREIGPQAARVTDKLPFNFRRLGLLHSLMPRARFIHCRRHPIDTCLSIYSIPFKARLDFVGNKSDLVFAYRQYERLMAHWRAILPAEQFLEVDYAQLIADREAQTRRIIAFTGLAWDDACLLPERNERSVRTASSWQARQPVYTTSVERWRHYEPWLGEFRELLPAAESG